MCAPKPTACIKWIEPNSIHCKGRSHEEVTSIEPAFKKKKKSYTLLLTQLFSPAVDHQRNVHEIFFIGVGSKYRAGSWS
jgi:hypothetical protein